MSQSDYIKRLKLATELRRQNELKPVLDSKDYTLFKEYTIVNTVKNNVQLYNELSFPEITTIFDMPLQNTNNCQTFDICPDTNKRINRVLNRYSFPSPVNLYKKHRINNLCSPCCYDTSINGPNRKKGNFFNTDFTKFANYRLRNIMCNCKEL
jgi:hypothetical protein